jgi:hypothetical protein
MVTTLEDLRSREWVSEEVPAPPPPVAPEPPVPSRSERDPVARRRRRLRIEGVLFFLVPLAAYLTFAGFLAFVWHSYHGDAQARLANAFYVLYSRDPHLAAVGFVWQPFTSFAELPLLLLKGLWSPLVRNFFAGNIMSALFMALAVHHARKTMLESGVPTPTRVILTSLLAFNPMIWLYGANAMSEAGYLFWLMVGVRYFVRWVARQRPVDLVVSGIGVGMAYMTRNEAVFSAGLATVAVFAITWHKSVATGVQLRRKVMTAMTDAVIFGLPFTFLFVAWAGTSWIIVGHPFEQLQGTYGTASMIKANGGFQGGQAVTHETEVHVLHDVLALGPLLPTLIVVGLVLSLRHRRRDSRPLGALTILGGGLLFSIYGALTHQTGGFLRYYICAVPLSIMLAAAIAARRPELRRDSAFRRWWWDTTGEPWSPAITRLVLSVVAVVAAVPMAATTWWIIHDPVYASEEAYYLKPLWHLGQKLTDVPSNGYYNSLGDAQYIDSLHLSNGSVLADNADGCVPFVILLSRHPAQFVIPNDRDFQQKLSDPAGFHIKYILSVPNKGLGTLDAINRADPDLYDNGGGIATLAKELGGTSCNGFKLYKVNPIAP